MKWAYEVLLRLSKEYVDYIVDRGRRARNGLSEYGEMGWGIVTVDQQVECTFIIFILDKEKEIIVGRRNGGSCGKRVKEGEKMIFLYGQLFSKIESGGH